MFRGSFAVLCVALLFSLLAACGDDSTDPSTTPTRGTLQVTAVTTGNDLDPDGYVCSIDGTSSRAVGPNHTTTFPAIEAGDHLLRLSAMSPNCNVAGENPRTVTITAGSKTETTFDVNCSAFTGAIQVTTVTTGELLDGDGYSLMLDDTVSETLGIDDSLTLVGLAPGYHTVELDDVQVNCELGDDRRRTTSIAIGDTARVHFEVTCARALFDKIAFVSSRDGRSDVFVMDTDGSNPVNLTRDTTTGAGYPAWSPDGTHIAFTRYAGGGSADVYVINIAGLITNRLTFSAGVELSAWSPDGNTIAYSSFTGPSQGDSWGDIYVVNLDGSNRINLTPGPLRGFDPAWSPDGSQIAFASERDGGLDIWLMQADGSNPVKLTDLRVNDPAYEPAWSPDGSRIAFVGPSGYCCGIWVMDADGSNQSKLTGETYTAWRPSWSPDGTKIAYYRSHSSPLNAYEIFVMEADGSDPVSLTYPGDGLYPAWSPPRP